MSDSDFWASSYRRIIYMVDSYNKEMSQNTPELPQTKEIHSMKEIRGWL